MGFNSGFKGLTTFSVAMSAGMQAVQCRCHDTERGRPLLGQKHVLSAQVSRGLGLGSNWYVIGERPAPDRRTAPLNPPGHRSSVSQPVVATVTHVTFLHAISLHLFTLPLH